MAIAPKPKAFNRFSTSRKVVGGRDAPKPSVQAGTGNDVLPPSTPTPSSADVRLPPTLTSTTTPTEGSLLAAADKSATSSPMAQGYSGAPARTARESYLSQGGAFVGGSQVGTVSYEDKQRAAEEAIRIQQSPSYQAGHYTDSSGNTVYRDSEGNVVPARGRAYAVAVQRDRNAGIDVGSEIKPGTVDVTPPTAPTSTAPVDQTAAAAPTGRNRYTAAKSPSGTVATTRSGLTVGSSTQAVTAEGRDTSNYGFGDIDSVQELPPSALADLVEAGTAEFGNETGIWSLNSDGRYTAQRREEDPEKYDRWYLTKRAIDRQNKTAQQFTPLPTSAGVQSRMGDGTPATVDMRTDYSWEGKSVSAVANDLLDMGGGQLRLDAETQGIVVVDGQRVVNKIPSEAARALNAMPEDLRRDVLGKLLDEGYLDYIVNADPETGVANPLGNDWNRAINGTVQQLQSERNGGYVNPSSPESFVLDKMLSSGEYRVEGDNLYEKGPHGVWVDMGSKAAVVGEIRELVQSFTNEDGSFDEAGFVNASDARYNSAVIEGLAEYQASDIPESTKLASTGAVAKQGEGSSNTLGDIQQAWQGTVDKLQNLPLLDADELIGKNRAYYNMQNAKAMRLNMNRMARGGSSPEAIQGTTAELDQQNRVAMAQQEAAVRMQTEMSNLQMQQQAIAEEMRMYETIYRTSADAEMQKEALAAQRQLAALNDQANARAARLQMEFQAQMASGPSVLQQIGQGVIGVAGAVLGPWTGGASVVAAGAANAGISAASNAARSSSALVQESPSITYPSYDNSPVKGTRPVYRPGQETLPAMDFADEFKYV